MTPYYMNKNPQPQSGDYEVHRMGCPTPAAPENQIHLGAFASCHPAVAEAKRRWPHLAHKINGCAHCSPLCHTT